MIMLNGAASEKGVKMPEIIIPDLTKLISGESCAILTPAQSSDAYLLNTWQTAGNFEAWVHKQAVNAIRQMYGRFAYEVGQNLTMTDLAGTQRCEARIVSIQMLIPSKINLEDLHLLGYGDMRDWFDRTSGGFQGRRGMWLFILEDVRVLSSAENTESKTIGIEIHAPTLPKNKGI